MLQGPLRMMRTQWLLRDEFFNTQTHCKGMSAFEAFSELEEVANTDRVAIVL